MTGEDPDQNARLAAEAERVRTGGGLGRSDLLIRLFDFLVESSLAGRAVKEIEIGQAVFGRGSEFDIVQDASVRVYMHRLRKKLDEFYADAPPAFSRLIVPRGEYRLTLADGAVPVDVGGEPLSLPEPTHRLRASRRFWAAVALFAICNALIWAIIVKIRSPESEAARVAATTYWKPLAAPGRPTLVVTGDYFIFGEAPDKIQVTRLVRQFEINSRDDLDAYLMGHPDDKGRYVDVDLHYLPVSVGSAMRDLLPVINAAVPDVRPPVITASQLAPPMLKAANVVYVGFLSGLGILRDPLFAASGFKIGSSYDELIDKKTGKSFTSDWGVITDGKMPHRDFAYIASLPGPTGNRLLVVAGTRDAAVMQASEIATDRQQLAKLATKAGSDGFEALYEVHTLGNQNLGSNLVLARPLKAGDIWQFDQPTGESFPDQLPPDKLGGK